MHEIDVVIPARNEGLTIERCLRALFEAESLVDLHVIVVANGCEDGTFAIARRVAREAPEGVAVTVREIGALGKPAALNLGDGLTRGGSVMYLDADAVLSPGALEATCRLLGRTDVPLLAAPKPVVLAPRTRLTRAFARAWEALPHNGVGTDVIGGGCVAVNASGRARWTAFPPLIADDTFVRSRFAPPERRVVPDATFLLRFPEGRRLIAMVARWRHGNRQFRRATRTGACPHRGEIYEPRRRSRTLAVLAAQPSLAPSLAIYIAVVAIAELLGRLAPRADPQAGAWRPTR